MEVFVCFIKDFHEYGLYGITYLEGSSAKILINNLRVFAKLLENGKSIIKALKEQELYEYVSKRAIGYANLDDEDIV